MLRKMIAALALVLGLTLAAPAGTASADLLGARWPGHSVYWYDGTGSAAVRSAATDWNAWRTRAAFNLYRGGSAYDPIRVYWHQLPAPRVGVANIAWSGTRLVSCTIYLSPAIRWNYYLLRATAAHELGHCLGMAHTRYWDSIMYPTARAWLYRPTWYDNYEMRALYGGLRAW